jgi:AcrR family transcriptional regulator
MSPRPRKASDDEVFAAAQRAMRRRGPAELTLEDIAGEAGVTASALVQRFGSKRELLLALSSRAAAAAAGGVAALRASARSPLAALRAYAACMAELADSPEALARNLAYLQLDLTEPELRVQLLRHARSTRAGLRRLIEEAVEAGELVRGADARRLARTVETVVGGSLFTWAVYRKGRAERWLRSDLEAVLAPYLARRRAR